MFCCFLVSAALFSPCTIIIENKSKDLGIKLSDFREHLTIRKIPQNSDPEEVVYGIMLGKWGIWAANNGNLSLLSKISYTKTVFYFDVKMSE